jgi:hypothetical protein
VDDRDVSDIAAKTCSLCGGPNDCALARGTAGRDVPCWCVDRRFPEALLAQGRLREGGSACICRGCLDAAAASPR